MIKSACAGAAQQVRVSASMIHVKGLAIMAPLPHNSTALYYFDYRVGTVNHTAELRAAGAHSPASAAGMFVAIVDLLAAALYESELITVRFQAAASNFSSIVSSGQEGHTWGTGVMPVDDTGKFMNFVGRGGLGRRVRMAIFGYKNSYSTFRITGSESPDVQDAVDLLNLSTLYGYAVDGTQATWYNYVNTGLNAYWQRRVRA